MSTPAPAQTVGVTCVRGGYRAVVNGRKCKGHPPHHHEMDAWRCAGRMARAEQTKGATP